VREAQPTKTFVSFVVTPTLLISLAVGPR